MKLLLQYKLYEDNFGYQSLLCNGRTREPFHEGEMLVMSI